MNTTLLAEAVRNIPFRADMARCDLRACTDPIHPGQGNIVSNDSAANARLAQDVETPTRHEPATGGTYHWGRGGEGNQVTLGTGDHKKKERSVSRGEAGHEKPSLLEKGKHALGLGNHKKE